ncbi:MAG: hypothetical protein MHM6MM_006813 [Cercozoa sp. M6MM]
MATNGNHGVRIRRDVPSERQNAMPAEAKGLRGVLSERPLNVLAVRAVNQRKRAEPSENKENEVSRGISPTSKKRRLLSSATALVKASAKASAKALGASHRDSLSNVMKRPPVPKFGELRRQRAPVESFAQRERRRGVLELQHAESLLEDDTDAQDPSFLALDSSFFMSSRLNQSALDRSNSTRTVSDSMLDDELGDVLGLSRRDGIGFGDTTLFASDASASISSCESDAKLERERSLAAVAVGQQRSRREAALVSPVAPRRRKRAATASKMLQQRRASLQLRVPDTIDEIDTPAAHSNTPTKAKHEAKYEAKLETKPKRDEVKEKRSEAVVPRRKAKLSRSFLQPPALDEHAASRLLDMSLVSFVPPPARESTNRRLNESMDTSLSALQSSRFFGARRRPTRRSNANQSLLGATPELSPPPVSRLNVSGIAPAAERRRKTRRVRHFGNMSLLALPSASLSRRSLF